MKYTIASFGILIVLAWVGIHHIAELKTLTAGPYSEIIRRTNSSNFTQTESATGTDRSGHAVADAPELARPVSDSK